VPVGPTKNAVDPWLRFKVSDVAGTGTLDSYVLVEWVTDPALLAGLAGRQPGNAWPFDAGSQAYATVYIANVPAYVYVPEESWAMLSTNRLLYYRLSFGSTPTPDATWTSYPPGQLIINHPPEANPGPPRVFQLDPNDALIDAFQLDGTGSTDEDMAASLGVLRDPGPLAFKWEVGAGPAVAALPWKVANFTQASPVALSAGTTIPVSAMGTYTFRLRTQDTDTPLATSTPGVDVAEVQHTVQRMGGGLLLFSPTSFAPRTFQLVEDLDVPITYKLDPGLLTDPAFAGGYFAELAIEDGTSGSAVMIRTTPVPPASFEGHFSWDGIFNNGSQPVSGQSFDIRIRLVDYGGNGISIPGRQTEDYQPNAIRINVTSVTIGQAATKAADFAKLVAGTTSVTVPISISTPAGAQAPSSLTLEVSVAGVVLADVPIPGIPNSFTWKGELGGAAKVPGPDTYQLRVVARHAGKVLARSNPLQVKVVRLRVDATSPLQTVAGPAANPTRVHRIEFAGPTMPILTVKSTIEGLSASAAGAQAREVRLEVSYVQGNRNDHYFLPGPLAANWVTLPGGIDETDFVFPLFRGGDLHVFAQALVDGVLIQANAGLQAIWGMNPPKATIRGAAGASSFIHAVLHKESRTTQFSESASVAVLSGFQPGPLTVLRSFDNGFGIGQLTGPVPNDDELWNWQLNLQGTLGRLAGFRASAQAFLGAHPPVTADQLDLETYARYNGGNGQPYHRFDAGTNTWVRRLGPTPAGAPATNADNADAVLLIRQQVDAGAPPAGW